MIPGLTFGNLAEKRFCTLCAWKATGVDVRRWMEEERKRKKETGHKTVAIKPEEEIRERGNQDYIVNLEQGKKKK